MQGYPSRWSGGPLKDLLFGSPFGRRSQGIGARGEVVFRRSDSRAEDPRYGGRHPRRITSLAASNPQSEFEKWNPMRVRVLVREESVWLRVDCATMALE
jgi:hypothetical protein